ncbi:MAG TPA: DUF2764 family protein [Candidatus Cloacimonadota bacterium]|nr:DUF2764 family protein [Candidatus Cloacimonadota bacterium]HPT70792.1 DUF2764 family protein [Candidatus Cloacimonadota bacterium]
MGREYYYYVAGLPSISIEDAKPARDLDAFRQDMKYHIHEDDYELVELLFLPDDRDNLLSLALNLHKPWKNQGNYPPFVLEDEIKDPQILPEFMKRFLSAVKEEIPIYPELSWENQLTTLFYEHVLSSPNAFIREWFEFERNINNLQTALYCRKNGIPHEKEIVGFDEVSNIIRLSNATDFGVSHMFPYLDKLFQIFENPDIMERERLVDQLKWNWIDDRNFFHYFDMDIILGYLAKVMIAERWQKLKPELGKDKFQSILDELEDSFQFSEDFTLAKKDRI